MSGGQGCHKSDAVGGCVIFKGRCSLEPREQRSPWKEGPLRTSVCQRAGGRTSKGAGLGALQPEPGTQCFKVKDMVKIFKCGWEGKKMLL